MPRELDTFTSWAKQYEQETDSTKQELLDKKMIGFIIGLEVSGNNGNAQECKKVYNKLKGI